MFSEHDFFRKESAKRLKFPLNTEMVTMLQIRVQVNRRARGPPTHQC